MISRKMFVFPVFVCILKNALKIFYSVWFNVKMKNKTHPNTTGMDKKPTTTSASHPTNPPPPRQATPQTHHHLGKPPHKPTTSHPATDPDPPWTKPPPESTKNPPATHETHCTKPKNQTQTADHLHRHTYTHHQQPKTGTPTSNPSPDLVKKKPKPRSAPASMGFLCERSRGGCLLCEISSRLTAVRDRRRRGCYARSVRGGDGAVQERERVQEGGGVGWEATIFWKMVYGKFFHKPFSKFYSAFFRSITNIFCWLWFYSETNVRKWWKHFTENVLRRNKRSLHRNSRELLDAEEKLLLAYFLENCHFYSL